jgi:hypothetical protein
LKKENKKKKPKKQKTSRPLNSGVQEKPFFIDSLPEFNACLHPLLRVKPQEHSFLLAPISTFIKVQIIKNTYWVEFQ